LRKADEIMLLAREGKNILKIFT